MTSKVLKHKNELRSRRKKRVRAKISGTEVMPRVTIFKSNRYLYAQAINDVSSITLAAADGKVNNIKSNKVGAQALGELFAKTLSDKNISEVVFDRNGYQYCGVIATFAQALRDNGIKL